MSEPANQVITLQYVVQSADGIVFGRCDSEAGAYEILCAAMLGMIAVTGAGAPMSTMQLIDSGTGNVLAVIGKGV
jgi:crotonobetainyl-CoA:carnitine CoA-transferase CaiB-like acyl-CoA transferase